MKVIELFIIHAFAMVRIHLNHEQVHNVLLFGVTTTHGTWLVLTLVGVHFAPIEILAIAFVASEAATNLYGHHNH